MGNIPGIITKLSEDNYEMVVKKQTDLTIGRNDKEKKIGLGRCIDMLLTELRLERLKKKQSSPD